VNFRRNGNTDDCRGKCKTSRVHKILTFLLETTKQDKRGNTCRITASNLSEQQKHSIKKVVRLLGGNYTVKMGHRNTHLVVPFAAGDKYKGAIRFEVAPVTYDWLVNVARSGTWLSSLPLW